nr:unnamed protein product [Callosobruchus chinensis]
MSTPSTPDPQKGELLSSDASEHGLLPPCPCQQHECSAPPHTPKADHQGHNHHNMRHVHQTHYNKNITASCPTHLHHQAKVSGACGGCCHTHRPPEEEPVSVGSGDDAGGGVCRKNDHPDDRIEVSPLPPALPPRPPPRPRYGGGGTLGSDASLRWQTRSPNASSGGIRKYVFWCCVCGGLSTVLGALFLAVYFLLRSYTSTLGYFETIPTFVPATMLILTGICVMSLARRKNRYSYLIKVCGICCLVCALTCVLVTITTTVIHMNRLQTLRECVYTQKTRTCTCYSVLLEAHATTDDAMRFVFDSTPDCEVIHGALYSCLRAMFGLSVSGILVCIFSCMLVYQLLSHEKKKMYWEQLELRCRSFYHQQQQQQQSGSSSQHGSVRGPPIPPAAYCSCCEECRYPPVPVGPQVYPWDTHHAADRFWAPGRIGNFYSPNPEDGPPPNPEGHNRARLSGWSWRRLPWSRASVAQNENQRDNSLTYASGMTSSSADSQYGFSSSRGGGGGTTGGEGHRSENVGGGVSSGSYSVLDNRPPPPGPPVVGGVYVWGPPPPYSNPNSPARRIVHSPGRYHHIHHHSHGHESHCQMNDANQQQQQFRNSRKARPTPKDNYENTTEPEVHQSNEHSSDTSSCADRGTHTLPARKAKKRSGVGVQETASNRIGGGFQGEEGGSKTNTAESDHDYHEPDVTTSDGKGSGGDGPKCRFLPRLQGVENAAFQKQETSPQKPEATESEVYFADVSSCCNISVRNDGQDSSLYDEAVMDTQQKPRLMSLQKTDVKEVNATKLLQNFQENISSSTVTEDEDYLAVRLGSRQMSTRSRLPFPAQQEDATAQLLPKDVSQNSLCSSVQTPLTETTDDAASPDDCCGYFQDNQGDQQQPPQPKPRTFAGALDHYLAPDAQYEVIPEQEHYRHHQPTSNLTNTISGLNYDQNYYNQSKGSGFGYCSSSSGPKNTPPKTLNLVQQATPTRQRNLGSNISTLIQNLGGNAAGLLYGDANVEDEVGTPKIYSFIFCVQV